MTYIYAVHYVTDQHGCEVIGEVKTSNYLYSDQELRLSKQKVIQLINMGYRFKTKYKLSDGVYREGEDVRVIDNEYLHTDANNKRADNLGYLPRY